MFRTVLNISVWLMVFGLGWTSISADSSKWPNRDENGQITPLPKGDKCIEPADVMRRNHMDLLLHKRDQTVHDGIRTHYASLNACIDCHVTPDSNGTVARISSEKHFCSSCHQAVSVKIDCFECHADRPVELFTGIDFESLDLPVSHKMRIDKLKKQSLIQ
jgi:hypothetical protein